MRLLWTVRAVVEVSRVGAFSAGLVRGLLLPRRGVMRACWEGMVGCGGGGWAAVCSVELCVPDVPDGLARTSLVRWPCVNLRLRPLCSGGDAWSRS